MSNGATFCGVLHEILHLQKCRWEMFPFFFDSSDSSHLQRTPVEEEADLIYNPSTGGHRYFPLGRKDKKYSPRPKGDDHVTEAENWDSMYPFPSEQIRCYEMCVLDYLQDITSWTCCPCSDFTSPKQSRHSRSIRWQNKILPLTAGFCFFKTIFHHFQIVPSSKTSNDVLNHRILSGC